MAYDREKIRKLVRMLEGAHGEAGNAAGILTKIAKEGGHNIDEMLAAVYGGSAHAEAPKSRTNYGSGPEAGFDWAADFDRSMRAAAEAMRRAEAKKTDRERAENMRDAYTYSNGYASASSDYARRKHKYSKLHDWSMIYGKSILTEWECNFLESIFTRGRIHTTAQEDVVDKIIDKYDREYLHQEPRAQPGPEKPPRSKEEEEEKRFWEI